MRTADQEQGMAAGIETLLGRPVVLDTAGSTLYLGRLTGCEHDGFWLEQADVHNTIEGHATREQYILEAARDGVRVNRHRVFVFRHTVISVSALDEVLKD